MPNRDIAIIGMSGIFPGAGDIHAFWKNIVHKVDAIQPVPAHRIDAVYFDADASAVDRFYCSRGGFIDDYAAFDPVEFGILPIAVEGIEPDHLLTLKLVYQALADAGVLDKKAVLEKTGIVIGKGNYTGPGTTRALEIVRTGEQIVQVLQNILPDLKDTEIDRIKKEFQTKKGRFSADTVMGLIPNLVASLVANRLNLGGVAYTLDAACASSLIAVDHAVQELHSGRADMMIAGGVHAAHNTLFWSIFTQLGALSRRQEIRPFDQQADGVLIGEGCGFVILKRLEDARRDDNRIYAVIKGVGISSDGSGTSVMSPSVKGQARAITQAWQQANVPLEEVGYIEAHGTGTPLGDRTELETLQQVFGSNHALPKAGLGTVKSMIGHAMPAAGIAGLIKTSLALYYGKLPPTLHCDNPLALMQQTRFAPVKEAVDWTQTGLPLRAGVNAFGFGGINAHVVLEADRLKTANAKHSVPVNGFAIDKKDEVLLLARNSKEALISALENGEKELGEGHYRIALFEPSAERIRKAIKIVAKDHTWHNRQDIWFTNTPLLADGGKLAFMFAGLDGLGSGEVDSIAAHFDLPRTAIAAASEAEAGGLDAALKLLDKSTVLDSAIKKLGVLPDMNAGHSMGEWLAVRSSEMVDAASVAHLLQKLNPASFEAPDTQFLAVGCGFAQIEENVKEIGDIYLSNDNCPQQVILCGTHRAVDAMVTVLRAKQIFYQVLSFQSGFHSPFIRHKLDLIMNGMEDMQFSKALIPVWSATTLETYPEQREAILQLGVEHLLKPVRFRELTEKLYQQGARMFIQIGAGGLIGFIDDTLKGRPFSAISSSLPIRPGLAQLRRVLAAVFVEGREIDLAFLGVKKEQKAPSKNAGLKLQLGSPIIKEITALKNIIPAALPAKPTIKEFALEDTGSPILRSFRENMEEINAIQTELLDLFNKQPFIQRTTPVTASAPPPVAKAIRKPVVYQLNISVDTHPYLLDHSLTRQRPGWHCIEDMDPVIPMTMTLELFGEIAAQQAPGEWVKKIQNIKVFQWLSVSKPFRETVTGEWTTPQLLSLNMEKYASAEVLLAGQPGISGTDHLDIGKLLPIQVTPEIVYDRYMFHGKEYQGIREVTAVGEKGIRGLIEGKAGKGSLLDNAGQLFGLWLLLTLHKDQAAFPVKIQEVEFFGDMMDQQGVFECTCEITELNDQFATADLLLRKENKVWAVIRGWQDRRLEIDERLWQVSMAPLKNTLSQEILPGIFFFHNAYSRVVSWDFIIKRYLNQEEKKYYHQALPINRKKKWLVSRIAVKDAVRMLLLRTTGEAYYPIEYQVRSNELGKPYLEGDMTGNVHISLAHKNNVAVATARYNQPVGIDIEEIQERGAGFNELVFTPAEMALLEGRDQAEWITRCWVAKEAYGKYLGKGLQGNPKAYVVEEINGEALRIKNVIIKTVKHNNYIIGWTS